jgi:hypothetical protein
LSPAKAGIIDRARGDALDKGFLDHRGERLLSHPPGLDARSWLEWGHELQVPKPGCIVVFWRGSRTAWEAMSRSISAPASGPVLGGNQRNGVSIEDYSARQVLGYRWPTTSGNSRTLRAQTAGAVARHPLSAGSCSSRR